MTETTETAKRNIIICCDGTGNEISENISNVLKLYRCLRKTEKTEPRQLVFYDPGVGTLSRPDPWHKLRQDFSAILGLATGYGLDEKVLQSYQFLVHNYREGDQIYLFGFSRGAYTVRVLAGLIHKVGTDLAGAGQPRRPGAHLLQAVFQRQPGRRSDRRYRRRRRRAAAHQQGRPGGAVRAHPVDAMADHPFRRRLGHGGERDRAAARPVLFSEF